MNALRSLTFAIWLYGSIAVVGLAGMPAGLLSRRGAVATTRVWARVALWELRVIGGVRVEIRGRDHIPAGSALIAAKHQAMLDTIVPFTLFEDPALVFKRELLRLPVYSFYALRARHIPVDREAHAAALKAMLRAAQAAAAEGRPIMIFPEGTRTAPGAPPDYKPGVAALYRALDVPCVPVALNTGLAWSAKGLKLTPGTVVIEFLPAIPTGLPRAEFMARLEHAIETASAALAPTRPLAYPAPV